MKRVQAAIAFIIVAGTLTGCGRNIPLEDLTIPLILGIDLDERNQLIFSEASPVFNKNAKKNLEVYQLEANSIRGSRKYFDTLATGEVTAAKIQVLLLGKRVLAHDDWYSILDTVYRNPTFSINTKVIVVDGRVSDVMNYEPKDKALLSLHLKDVIDKNIKRTRTVINTLQVLHRDMYEKGITPSITEVKKEKDVQLAGVSLLDQKGKYVDSLGIQEVALLQLLKKEKREELTFTLPIASIRGEGGIFHKNVLSIDVKHVRTKIKTRYVQDRFRFDYGFRMHVALVERLFSEDSITRGELERMIEKELTARFEDLIKKIQNNRIDPIGLGIYARAYQYQHYKKVEKHWAAALAESDIHVSVDVIINTMGAVK